MASAGTANNGPVHIASIENAETITPATDDLVVIQDISDNNKLKTATVSAVGTGGDAVSSVFSRTGDVVAAADDYTADQIGEGALDIGANTLTVNSVEVVGSDGEVNKAAVEDSGNWDTAYTHSQDNTQAHSDYLLNSGDDSSSGRITAAGLTSSSTMLCDDTTEASSTTAASLQTDGGLGVVKNARIGGQMVSDQQSTLTPSGTTQTIDWNDGNSVTLDLGSASGDVTLTLSNPVSGGSYLIKMIQGATARDVVLPSTVTLPGETAPVTLNITAVDDAVDVLALWYDGTNYQAQFSQNYG
nr:hypothetical protein 24 [Legionellales bacterium]